MKPYCVNMSLKSWLAYCPGSTGRNGAPFEGRSSRLGAIGRSWWLSVVTVQRFLPLAQMPCSRMSFWKRSLPARMPLASSSFHARGQP